MRYWRKGNDLYTGDTAPIDAVEITETEYTDFMSNRTVTHIEPIEDDAATEQDFLDALAEMGVAL